MQCLLSNTHTFAAYYFGTIFLVNKILNLGVDAWLSGPIPVHTHFLGSPYLWNFGPHVVIPHHLVVPDFSSVRGEVSNEYVG